MDALVVVLPATVELVVGPPAARVVLVVEVVVDVVVGAAVVVVAAIVVAEVVVVGWAMAETIALKGVRLLTGTADRLVDAACAPVL